MSFGGWRAWQIKIMSRIMSRSWQQKVSVYGQPQAEHIHITSTRFTTPCMRWRATKPVTARPSRVCWSGTSASKKFRYCLKSEGCILKEVQPSFRVLNAKLCHIYVARGFPRHIGRWLCHTKWRLYFAIKRGLLLKTVQPLLRKKLYKSCTPSFKLRQKERENSPKWYIEEVVHIS